MRVANVGRGVRTTPKSAWAAGSLLANSTFAMRLQFLCSLAGIGRGWVSSRRHFVCLARRHPPPLRAHGICNSRPPLPLRDARRAATVSSGSCGSWASVCRQLHGCPAISGRAACCRCCCPQRRPWCPPPAEGSAGRSPAFPRPRRRRRAWRAQRVDAIRAARSALCAGFGWVARAAAWQESEARRCPSR